MLKYGAKILLDSINDFGDRLTTVELTIPKWLQAELNTHRLFTRSSASSRARPNAVIMQEIAEFPVIPVAWLRNQSGMQGGEQLQPHESAECDADWLEIRDLILESAPYKRLVRRNVAKQTINRLLESWMFTKIIVSATDFSGFFFQRCHKAAQPELRVVAEEFQAKFKASVPTHLPAGHWHLPLIREDEQDLDLPVAIRVSAGRCARASYQTHDGIRSIDADLDLFDRLTLRPDETDPAHWSPLEHVARSQYIRRNCGNFRGFTQLRKFFANEHATIRNDVTDTHPYFGPCD